MSVTRIRQDPFNWSEVFALVKEGSTFQQVFTDPVNQHEYNVTVCKDTSYSELLVDIVWTASPEVRVETFARACCELIVQADDEQVSISCLIAVLSGL